MLIAGTSGLVAVGAPSADAVTPSVVVPNAACQRFDPNLVAGACLKYQSRSGFAYTWIGTYRATNGAVFFCIDFLYDSRINGSASRVSTAGLRNQFGRSIRPAEVAALNYLISIHAPSGTTGTAYGNAAIALIIREVMSDGIRRDGTVVYPPGLRIYGRVLPPPGGLTSSIMSLAQRWWTEASAFRGRWSVWLTPESTAPMVPLGQSARYRLRVVAASGANVSGARVTFRCTGPISCPEALTSASTPQTVVVTPQALGTYVLSASVSGPSDQGQLLQGPWAPHGGTTARNNGVQRGWIVQRVAASASATGAAEIVKATPRVATKAQPTARPGGSLSDQVVVSGLPPAYDHTMTATLYGPFDQAPSSSSCTSAAVAGRVSLRITANGTFRTPGIAAPRAGYYVWTESLPGDANTVGVQTPCGEDVETTLVRPAPTLATVASRQISGAASILHDEIELSGSGGATLSLTWRLLGPVEPNDHGCVGIDWSRAPVFASGELSTSGDGHYRTVPVTVTHAGCYTYVESIAATATSGSVASTPGESAETVLVVDRPALHTVASTTHLQTSGTIFDTITVSGVSTGSIGIQWSLLGPIAPQGSGCDSLDWSSAPIRAQGQVNAGNGQIATPRIRVVDPGCYTFRESSAATPDVSAAASPAGLGSETALVTRPPLPRVPEVPTGAVIAVPGSLPWAENLARLLVA